MKHVAIIAFFLIIGCTATAQEDSIRGNQFHLTGKLKADIQRTPFCGFVAWATVVEFEVINLSGMSHSIKNIGIIVTCPEIYSASFFEKGKTYHVVFADKNQADFSWAIINKDYLKNNTVSFDPYLISVKKIP